MKRSAPLKRGTSQLKRTPLPPRAKRMKPRSDRMAALYRDVRAPLVAALLAERPWCEIRWDSRCWRRATEVHEPEMRSRVPGPELISDPARCKAACHWCHRMVHDHPADAEARGLLVPSGQHREAP